MLYPFCQNSCRQLKTNRSYLQYDGHGSHETVEMIDTTLENNIILFCLIPHTMHHLQPCDVGVFGPLKKAWNHCCEVILSTTGEQLKASDVVREYLMARKEAFKEETIKQTWWKAGIGVDDSGTKPRCNPSIFTDADFALSISTSTQLHLPEGYPVDVALTPDNESIQPPSTSIDSQQTALSVHYIHFQDESDSDDSDAQSDWSIKECHQYYSAKVAKYKAQRDMA
jgi:hypothetical protein